MARLETEELQRLVDEDSEAALAARPAAPVTVTAEPHLMACLSAVDRLDGRGLETSLMRATVALPAPVLIQDVVGPLLARIGEQWEHGRLSVGHEHLASAVIRRVLESIMNACAPEPDAPAIVVATPAGQAHEFGALLVGAAAAAFGWRVTYLGTSLPGSDIAGVALNTGARAIALSIVYPGDDPRLGGELEAVREATGQEAEILVGGRSALNYRESIESIGAMLITDVSQLVEFLENPNGDRSAPGTRRA